MIELIGSEGVITINGDDITLKRSVMPEAPGFGGYDSLFTFPKSMQEELTKAYNAKWSPEQTKRKAIGDIIYKAPEGYSSHVDHFTNFFDAIRNGTQVVEDAEFGFRAAAPALSCNESYFSEKIVEWDPQTMKLR